MIASAGGERPTRGDNPAPPRVGPGPSARRQSPYATCGLCPWRLDGDDMGALQTAMFEHVKKTHPTEWDDWEKTLRNGRYLWTGEGGYER